MATLYHRPNIANWSLRYRCPLSGRLVQVSTGTDNRQDAEAFMHRRLADLDKGIPAPAKDMRVSALLDDLMADYKMTGKRSLDVLTIRIEKHLKPALGYRKAVALTTAEIRGYIVARQGEGAAAGTIALELSALKRAFNLAIQDGRLVVAPHIPSLRLDNARTGYFEQADFEALDRHLPDYLRPALRCAYITGWRTNSEVLKLQWRHIDFAGRCIRLDPDMTKNQRGRVFPFTPELDALLKRQRECTTALERQQGRIIPCVFHRAGEPIRDFRAAWSTACRLAGCPGKVPQDFRRTAVRNLVRAGVPERVAMTLTGHNSRSVLDRYAIVAEPEDLQRWMTPQVRPIEAQVDLSGKTPAPALSPWLDALLASGIFAAQRTAAGRGTPADDKIRAFLLALDERGGTLTRAAVGQKLGLPPVRVPGTIAVMRRLLNVDGYEVLSLDEESDAITLNLELLRVQFELTA